MWYGYTPWRRKHNEDIRNIYIDPYVMCSALVVSSIPCQLIFINKMRPCVLNIANLFILIRSSCTEVALLVSIDIVQTPFFMQLCYHLASILHRKMMQKVNNKCVNKKAHNKWNKAEKHTKTRYVWYIICTWTCIYCIKVLKAY